ncbi:MAG: HEAT repeat domain-containing protein [Acidobacteria bacterium]|nr:HEAT repeat domain-containing protein [Acidobacteriota bacterium]
MRYVLSCLVLVACFAVLYVNKSETSSYFYKATSEIIPGLYLVQLTSDSDLIVVGQTAVLTEEKRERLTEQGHSFDVVRYVSKLKLNRLIKGKTDDSLITVQFLSVPTRSYILPTSGRVALFFLRKVDEKRYEPVEPYYPFLAAISNTPKVEKTDLDRVVGEVGQALEYQNASETDKRVAIVALGSVDTEAAKQPLRRISNGNNISLQIAACAALFGLNDVSQMSIAERLLLNPPKNVPVSMIQKLSSSLARVKDPTAIPFFSRLLAGGDIQTRRNAAMALRNTGDVQAIIALTVTLMDSDTEVRYQGVMGLATITKQWEWAPAYDIYSSNEQRYLKYWREWAKNNR